MSLSKFNENTQSKLNDLLQRSYDAKLGYQKVAEKAENPSLKAFLSHKANERNEHIAELRQTLVNNGLEIKETDGTVAGSLHRGWINAKTFFSHDSDEAVLEEVRNGEKVALDDYQDVISSGEMPAPVKSILEKQRQVIQSSYNKADYLEGMY